MTAPASPVPSAPASKVRRLLQGAPVLPGFLLAALAAGAAYVTRYQFVEPEAMGELCLPDAAPWWCTIRTGLVVGTQWGLFGWVALALAALAFAVPPRWARTAGWAAMVVGGAGLYLYNTTGASVALVFALMRLAGLGMPGRGVTAQHTQQM